MHPHEQTLLVYRLNQEGKYVGERKPFVKGDLIPIGIFDDFDMDLGRVFS